MNETPCSTRILACNPGSRYLALAFFEGTELQDWRIRVFKGRWRDGKGRRIVSAVEGAIDFYAAEILALKRLPVWRSSPQLDRAVGRLKQRALRQGLEIREYSIETLKVSLGGGAPVNKQKLAELISQRYPVLLSAWETERRHKNPYHIRLFEAVAVGVVCVEELDDHH